MEVRGDKVREVERRGKEERGREGSDLQGHSSVANL